MSSIQVSSEIAIETPRARRVDMKLEVVVIPVSDVDRAKRFYGGLDWRLDADFAWGDEFRVVQFTPPGSSCSIHFGRGVMSAPPGSAQGLLSHRVRHRSGARRAHRSRCRRERNSPPYRPRGSPSQRPAGIRSDAVTPRSPRSTIPTATAGCFKRSLSDCPDAWTGTQHSPRRLISRPRSDARRLRMASTRSAPARRTRTGPTGTPSTSSGSRRAGSCRHDHALRRPRAGDTTFSLKFKPTC